jgi:hypothetical protein
MAVKKNPGTYNGKQNREGLLYCFRAQIMEMLYQKRIIMQEYLYYEIILLYICMCIMCVCTYCINACVCARIHVCMDMCMYVCMHVRIHVYTVWRKKNACF